MARVELKSKRELIYPPNLFTYGRLLLVVPTVLLMLQPGARGWWGLGLFVLAASTDKVDGWLARRNDRRWATGWGKFIDPLADKVLVLAVLVRALFVVEDHLHPVLVIVLVTVGVREIVVAIVKAQEDEWPSAAQAGRFSMLVQSVGVGMLLVPSIPDWWWQDALVAFLLCAGLGASLCSGWVYVAEWRALKHQTRFRPVAAGQEASLALACISLILLVIGLAAGWVNSDSAQGVVNTAAILPAGFAAALCTAWIVLTEGAAP